jgi:class 3 adenylate cyclase
MDVAPPPARAAPRPVFAAAPAPPPPPPLPPGVAQRATRKAMVALVIAVVVAAAFFGALTLLGPASGAFHALASAFGPKFLLPGTLVVAALTYFLASMFLMNRQERSVFTQWMRFPSRATAAPTPLLMDLPDPADVPMPGRTKKKRRMRRPGDPVPPDGEEDPGEVVDPADVMASLPADQQAEARELLKLLASCLQHLTQRGEYLSSGKLDSAIHFPCHLFFAGLCHAAADAKRWRAEIEHRVMGICLGVVFEDADHAAEFAEGYTAYLTQPNYLAIFRRGVETYERWRGGDSGAVGMLTAALDEWSRPGGAAAEVTHPVIVMFTDIVGSTEHAQTHGDAAHVKLVQAHNRIVRGAVDANGGREIKHTGDGIMAAFDDAGMAGRAALAIQQEIEIHGRADPETAMQLRIGLSLGIPIREDQDLFGTTVQLAARLCGTAEPGEVRCDAATGEAAAAAGLTANDLGDIALKGFPQPVRAMALLPS